MGKQSFVWAEGTAHECRVQIADDGVTLYGPGGRFLGGESWKYIIGWLREKHKEDSDQ